MNNFTKYQKYLKEAQPRRLQLPHPRPDDPMADRFILKDPADFDAFEAEVGIALEQDGVLGWVKDAEYIKFPPWRAPPLPGKVMGSEQDEYRALEWHASDAKARTILLNHLDPPYRREFGRLTTARAMWQSLESRMRNHTARSLYDVLAEWSSVDIGDDELDPYVKRFESLCARLDDALAQERMQPMDPHLHALQFLRGLQNNSWYQRFTATQLKRKPKELSFERLRYDIFDPKWFRGLDGAAPTPAGDTAASVPSALGPRVLDYDHGDSPCYIHSTQGHRNKDCFDQNPSRRNQARPTGAASLSLHTKPKSAPPTRSAAPPGSKQARHPRGGITASPWFRNDVYGNRNGSAGGSSSSGRTMGAGERARKPSQGESEGTSDLIDVGDSRNGDDADDD